MFKFSGPAILSKSWLNRFQIIRYFNPQLPAVEMSDSEDVHVLQKAIEQVLSFKTDVEVDNESFAAPFDVVNEKNSFYLGQGGTSLRFFLFLISRKSGDWTIKAHPRLLERPQTQIRDILNQLNVNCEFGSDAILISSKGWQLPSAVKCDVQVSSQFISGLLLSSWGLKQDLRIDIKKPVASFDYLKMTIDVLVQAGMKISASEETDQLVLKIPANQKAVENFLRPEPDVSSVFSLMASAVVDGEAEVTNWNKNSTQPDIKFLNFFEKMNIDCFEQATNLKISKHNTWKSLEANLNNSPDLFPVLAVLCALAEGRSHLYGAEQLRHKESDRIKKTHELLSICGFQCEMQHDGIVIIGRSSCKDLAEPIVFNPDKDHRMAMAAALLKLKGFNIKIQTPEVVNKSYPNFWKDVAL